MTFYGHFNGIPCEITLTDIGRLTINGEYYNDEYYDEDDIDLVRTMLIRDGIQLV